MPSLWRYKGPNPITHYSLQLDFADPISEGTLQKVVSAHSKVKDDLPRRLEQRAVTVTVGQHQSPPSFGALSGVIFDALDLDGTPLRVLATTASNVSFTVQKYKRWIEFWPLADRLLSVVLDIVKESAAISALTLTAINRFEPAEGNSTARTDDLFRRGTPYVCQNFFDCNAYTHSHHGFIWRDEANQTEFIDNINVMWGKGQVGEQLAEATFQLHQNLEKKLDLVGLDHLSEVRSTLSSMFKGLHDRNNMIFKDVIIESEWQDIEGLGRQ